jgi:outer membrane protein assembly factor BamB
MLYVSLYQSGKGIQSIQAFDRSTGQERWHYDSPVPLNPPLLTPGALYLGGANQRLYAINTANGTLLWTYQTASFPQVVAARDGILLVGALPYVEGNLTPPPDAVYALNARDGSLKWRSQVQGFPRAAIDDTLYLQTTTHELYALRTSDGSVRWHMQPGGNITDIKGYGKLVAIFLRTAGPQEDAGTLALLNADTGAEAWRYAGAQVGSYLLPLADGSETLYLRETATSINQDAAIVALGVSDGSVRWKKQIDQPKVATEADGVFYVGEVNGTVAALDVVDGSLRWQASSEAGGPTSPFVQDLRVDHGLVYVTRLHMGDGVIAFDASNGSVRWHDQGDGFTLLAGLNAGVVCFLSITGKGNTLHVAHADDGSILWQHDYSPGMTPAVALG